MKNLSASVGLVALGAAVGCSSTSANSTSDAADTSAFVSPGGEHAGTYSAAFAWDGRNWTGPSDTSNPKGDYFPVGAYRLDIIAQGSQGAIDAGATAFSVNAAFGINLIK